MTGIKLRYNQQKNEFKTIVTVINNNLKALQCNYNEARKTLPIKFESPAGLGKTTLVHDLSRLFNCKLFIESGTTDTNRVDMEGYFTSDDDGNLTHIKGRMCQAIEEANKSGKAIYLINEFNAIPENEQIGLNELMDFQAQVNLSSASDITVKVNDGCCLIIIATMNYDVSGIYNIQDATDSRFLMEISLDYPNQEKEIETLMLLTGINEEIAEKLVKFANNIRESRKKRQIPKSIGTRELVNFLSLVKMNGRETDMIENLIESCLIHKLAKKEEHREVILSIIETQEIEDFLINNIDDFCYKYEQNVKIPRKNNKNNKNNKNDDNIELGFTQEKVLNYLCGSKNTFYAKEIAEKLERQPSHINQVLKALLDLNLVEKIKISERKNTWRISEHGKKYIEVNKNE